MIPMRCLVSVAGVLVLASCSHIEDARWSSLGLPLQQPSHGVQAPVLDLGRILHVGAAVSPPAHALAPTVRHGAASVHHGELPHPVTRAKLVAYLREDALSYVRDDAEAGPGEQLFPSGLVLRFAAEPPVVRIAEGTAPELVDEVVRVVQLLNMALPRGWQIGVSDEPGAAGTTDPGPLEILVAFAAQEDWPHELRSPENGDIGLALPRFELHATGDPDRPFHIEITGGRIWIDPTRTDGAERLGVIAHEIIHLLGRNHPDPARFPDTIMVAGGGEGPTEHVLHPLDRAALLAVYSRLDAGGTPGGAIDIELGPWADASTHLYGVLGLSEGELAFGAVASNGHVQPWASGPTPDSLLEENSRLAGSAHWSGRLLGLTPATEAVAGGADLTVHLDSLDGELSFRALEYWPAGVAPGAIGTGSIWRDGELGYRIEVRGNTFVQTGGDAGAVTGAFFGDTHEGMGGVLVRDDLSAGFGGIR